HPNLLRDDVGRVDLLEPVTDGREREVLLAAALVEPVELTCGRQRAVRASGQVDRLRKLEHADVVQEELRLRERWVGCPPDRVDRIRTTRERICRVALHVRLRED